MRFTAIQHRAHQSKALPALRDSSIDTPKFTSRRTCFTSQCTYQGSDRGTSDSAYTSWRQLDYNGRARGRVIVQDGRVRVRHVRGVVGTHLQRGGIAAGPESERVAGKRETRGGRGQPAGAKLNSAKRAHQRPQPSAPAGLRDRAQRSSKVPALLHGTCTRLSSWKGSWFRQWK